MTGPDWIWVVFIFVFGCCVGSFLNVVIYRLPLDKSLIRPRSSCPACGKLIHFYDNIPLLSWVLLRAKCRYCKAPISPRYFVIELLTGLVFVGLFLLYFHTKLDMPVTLSFGGAWFIYLLHVILLSGLIAASAIDLKLWVIPISICWFMTAVGLVGSALAGYLIDPETICRYELLPMASAKTGLVAAGAAIGTAISCILLGAGLIKRSYESQPANDNYPTDVSQPADPRYHRLQSYREVIFLLPIIIGSVAVYWLIHQNPSVYSFWSRLLQHPVISGLMGSLFGYFVGCAVVWATRILGTLGFGKEAMGLGDVHLMGAAGALIGYKFVLVAFFIAPFFGLAWASVQMFYKKIRQIPYGPFLSLAVFTVMIFHDRILRLLEFYVSSFKIE